MAVLLSSISSFIILIRLYRKALENFYLSLSIGKGTDFCKYVFVYEIIYK